MELWRTWLGGVHCLLIISWIERERGVVIGMEWGVDAIPLPIPLAQREACVTTWSDGGDCWWLHNEGINTAQYAMIVGACRVTAHVP